MGRKRKFQEGRNEFLKSKKQILKVPSEVNSKIKKEYLKKYGLKSFQELFDYLVVSGIVYLDSDVISIIDNQIDFYKKRDAQAKLARLGKAEAPIYPKYIEKIFMMYPKDFAAFGRYITEKNYAKQWVSEILFSEFVNDNPKLISIIDRAQNLDVRKRKNQISRLAQDEWIMCLDENDSLKILEQLTDSYDNRKFSNLIQNEIIKFHQKTKDEEVEEELELEMQKKMEEIRKARKVARKMLSDEHNKYVESELDTP